MTIYFFCIISEYIILHVQSYKHLKAMSYILASNRSQAIQCFAQATMGVSAGPLEGAPKAFMASLALSPANQPPALCQLQSPLIPALLKLLKFSNGTVLLLPG